MKKIFVLILLLFHTFSFAVNGATIDFTNGQETVNVLDDSVYTKTSDVSPLLIDGKWKLPLRITAETFGDVVLWEETDKTITVSSDDIVVKIKINDIVATVNDKIVELDSAPLIIDDRTMVSPLFFELCLGYGIRYVEADDGVLITDEKPIMRIGDSFIYFDEVKLLFDADKDKYKGEEELLVKSCISNLYDTAIMYNESIVKRINFTDDERAEILQKSEQDVKIYDNTSLKSIYTYILSKRKLADKFSDILSNESIPDEAEILKYFEENFPGNDITDDGYEEIRYLLGYEKFVENWNKLYEATDDEMFYSVEELVEILK